MSFVPHHQHLADVVYTRRSELGLSRSAVAERGGPAEPTLIRIESAEGRPLQARTLHKLDHALQWRAGSAWNVYAGGDPAVLDDETPLISGHVSVSISDIAKLVEVSTQLVNALEDAQDLDAARRAARAYRDVLSPIVGTIVSALMEGDHSIQVDRTKLGSVLGHFLAVPAEDRTPARTMANKRRRALAGEI